LRKILFSRKQFDDEMMNMLLISPRPGLHHLLIDEINELMDEMVNAFPGLIKL